MLDLILAVAHHLLIFAVFGVLLAEFVALRGLTSSEAVARIAAVDLWYGVLATLIVIVGFSRAVFAAKGWSYYSHNAFFWAKLATFAVIGLLSIRPTLAFVRWRRSGTVPDNAAIQPLRMYLHIELTLFVFLVVFAAAMARGYGEF
jgi:putative membrane protein